MQRRIIVYILAVFMAAVAVPAFSQYAYMVGKTYPKRYRSLDSLFLHRGLFSFDSLHAFRMLDTIKALAKDKGDDEMVMEMELMRCSYYTRGAQPNKPACGPCLEALLAKAIQKQNKQLQVRIHASLGYFYRYDHPNYGLALEHQLKSYYMVKDFTTAAFPNKMEIISGVAGAYYRFGDYETAKKLMLESIAAGNSYKTWFNLNINNNLGLIYRDEGKYDSAIYFFTRAMNVARKDGNRLWVAITSGNVGTAYFLQGKYDKAEPLLEYSVQQSVKEDKDNAVKSLVNLASINLYKKNTEKAAGQLLQARSLLDTSAASFSNLKDLYPLMAKYYAGRGNTSLAYIYADSALAAKDSFNNSMNTLVLARAQQHAQAEKYLADVQKLDGERKVQVLLRNGLLIIVVLLGALAILFINRQKIAYSRRQEKLENEKLLVESELTGAVAQLDAFTRSIQEKNELIERFTAELGQLQSTGQGIAATQHNDILLQLQEATILTEDEWKHFKMLFEKVHGGFLNRLRERLPDLSPAEIRFMALSKLKLTNKEMAGILGISTDAVRMNRHRLRKKLNLPLDMGIEELADSV